MRKLMSFVLPVNYCLGPIGVCSVFFFAKPSAAKQDAISVKWELKIKKNSHQNYILLNTLTELK